MDILITVGDTLISAGVILIMDSLTGDGTTHTTDMVDTDGVILTIMDGIIHTMDTITDITIVTILTAAVDEDQNTIRTPRVLEIILPTEPIPTEIQTTPIVELLQTDKPVLHLHEEINIKVIPTVANPEPTAIADKVPVTTATVAHPDLTVHQAALAAEDHTLPEVATVVEVVAAVAEEAQEEVEDKYPNL